MKREFSKERTCRNAECGKVFTANHMATMHCSRGCSKATLKAALKAKADSKPAQERTCVTCGASFLTKHWKAKTCSAECSKAMVKATVTAWLEAKRKPQVETCCANADCYNRFIPAHGNTVFCSHDCRKHANTPAYKAAQKERAEAAA
jgi:hypothetical protein